MTTLEYAMLFVVLAVGGMATWTALTDNVSDQMTRATAKTDRAFGAALKQAPNRGHTDTQGAATTGGRHYMHAPRGDMGDADPVGDAKPMASASSRIVQSSSGPGSRASQAKVTSDMEGRPARHATGNPMASAVGQVQGAASRAGSSMPQQPGQAMAGVRGAMETARRAAMEDRVRDAMEQTRQAATAERVRDRMEEMGGGPTGQDRLRQAMEQTRQASAEQRIRDVMEQTRERTATQDRLRQALEEARGASGSQSVRRDRR